MGNIIFLDVDGVMNTEKDRSLNKDAVKRLARLVNKTDSKIILHSGWRFWFDNNMTPLSEEAEDFAESLDTAGIFLSGRTPDFSTEDIRSSQNFNMVKADEILEWLKTENYVDNWVVLDDLDLHNDIIRMHQVFPNPEYGFSDDDLEKAKKILNCS